MSNSGQLPPYPADERSIYDYSYAQGRVNPFVRHEDGEDPFGDRYLSVPSYDSRSQRSSEARGARTQPLVRSLSRSQGARSDDRYISPYASHQSSAKSSRRNSVESNHSTQRLFGAQKDNLPYGYNHDVNSSTALNTETIGEKFAILPDLSLLSDPAFAEDDDDLHDPNKDNPLRDTNIWTRRGLVNLGGLICLILGLLVMFIAIPAITFWREKTQQCVGDQCLDVGPRALLSKPRMSLIDPDTPQSAYQKTTASGQKLSLVFSDEFNQEGRTFYPGDDQFWEAVDIWYWPTQDLEWYDPDAVTTEGGYLKIQLDAFKNHDLNYRSGMLQSWNKLCFKGGMIESSVQLPGSGMVSGEWPAFWTMGNLARPGYGATTDGMWPYSYQGCDVGITPNQSRTDGLSFLPGMRLPSCVCNEADTIGSKHGRSAPEIDVIEASVAALSDGTMAGVVSQTFQVAPFDEFYQPNYAYVEIYNDTVTSMNNYVGGPFQQAFSGLSTLNNQWYQTPPAGVGQFQTYAFNYIPGSSSSSMIEWYVGDSALWKLQAASLGPNGNIGQRPIAEEPMSIIMNLALSESFANIQWTQLQFPSVMKFDYVRIYQDTTSITCDPPGWETTSYISAHQEAYTNPNITQWSQLYDRPKNSFMDKC